MKHEAGNWFVSRNCCISGNCGTCHDVTPVGKPLRVVQGSGYSEAYARWLADRWSSYAAKAMELDQP